MSSTAVSDVKDLGQTTPNRFYSLILGSASPRRQKLLKYLGQPFKSIPANIDETKITSETPAEYALRMAQEKAMKIAQMIDKSSIVIGGDTVVALDNEVLGKPASVQEAKGTLSKLANHEHKVLSAWAIVERNSKQVISVLDSGVCQSIVSMRAIDDQEMNDGPAAAPFQTPSINTS